MRRMLVRGWPDILTKQSILMRSNGNTQNVHLLGRCAACTLWGLEAIGITNLAAVQVIADAYRLPSGFLIGSRMVYNLFPPARRENNIPLSWNKKLHIRN